MIKLNKFEENNKDLCWVNMQKNLKVFNLKTRKEDFIYSGVRLYQADDVDKIIKEAQKELLEELKTMININEQNHSEDVLNQWIYRKLK